VENGIARQSIGEVRDLSESGMSCWVAQRIPAFSEIRIECHTQRLHGDAVVRHCNNHGARFLLGIEFRGSLTWRPGSEASGRRRWD
jgi:PilZ domain